MYTFIIVSNSLTGWYLLTARSPKYTVHIYSKKYTVRNSQVLIQVERLKSIDVAAIEVIAVAISCLFVTVSVLCTVATGCKCCTGGLKLKLPDPELTVHWCRNRQLYDFTALNPFHGAVLPYFRAGGCRDDGVDLAVLGLSDLSYR